LPEAPFDMLLTITAEGEASGGDRLTTNAETLVIAVTPDVLIPPTQSGGGISAGGDLSGIGGSGGGGVVS
ncbi:MAG: hypothetical protein KDD70_01660, partial [Bdellovibrionales bacterium]|nr:hypothetical protein [Bdellovibrionales bacterium]